MSTYTAEDAYAAAAKGAAWMDEHCEGWTLLLDVNTLDLSEPAACILGQTAHCVTEGAAESNTFDSYQNALDYIVHEGYNDEGEDEQRKWAREHGFDITYPGGFGNTYQVEMDARFEMLTIAWEEEIRKRAEVVA